VFCFSLHFSLLSFHFGAPRPQIQAAARSVQLTAKTKH
jgi:hypothetical protein